MVLAELGNDPRGECLREGLFREGVDLPEQIVQGPLTRVRQSTGAVVEMVKPGLRGGHLFVFTCPKCGANLRGSNVASRGQIEELTPRLKQFDVLFFDRAAPALLELARQAREEGVLLVFEPNHLARGSRNEQAAVLSHVVKYARESGKTPTEWLPPRNSSPRLLIETLGSDGLKYCLRRINGSWSRWKHMPAIASARLADTAGAGDWCTAGIIEQLARTPAGSRWTRTSVERALTLGQALAAVSVSFQGPRGALMQTSATRIRRIAKAASMAGSVSVHAVGRLKNSATPVTVGDRNDTCPLCLSRS